MTMTMTMTKMKNATFVVYVCASAVASCPGLGLGGRSGSPRLEISTTTSVSGFASASFAPAPAVLPPIISIATSSPSSATAGVVGTEVFPIARTTTTTRLDLLPPHHRNSDLRRGGGRIFGFSGFGPPIGSNTFTTRTSSTITTTTTRLSMALIPLSKTSLARCLVLGLPTGEQYSTYWGRTSRERFDAAFESAAVTFLGLFGSYFLSFVLGTPVATLLGSVAAFWVLLGPELRAYQRNWELLGGRELVDPWTYDDDRGFDIYGDDGDGGLRGALYVASIERVTVVDDGPRTPPGSSGEYPLSEFGDYTAERDENDLTTGVPYMLRLNVRDRDGRSMQVHARMSEDYVDVEVGMVCVCVLLSTDVDFGTLAGLTEFYIPDAGCYVGDYPYLDKMGFVGTLRSVEGVLEAMDEEDLLFDADDGEVQSTTGIELYNEGRGNSYYKDGIDDVSTHDDNFIESHGDVDDDPMDGTAQEEVSRRSKR